jgi:IPT/TIG domain-containing protein
VLNPAPGGGVSNALTFTITPALTVTSVAPNQGAQGAVVPVTITGTGFAAGASVSVSGSGVTASNVAVASSTQITVTLTIAAKAPTNARKVTVTNSKGASAALMGGFTVTAP